jgi:hypothetical protein
MTLPPRFDYFIEVLSKAALDSKARRNMTRPETGCVNDDRWALSTKV